MRSGCVNLCTPVQLERNTLSAAEQHRVPSVVVAHVTSRAVTNDVVEWPEAAGVTAAGVLERWLAHGELFTAVAASRCELIALSKERVVQSQGQSAAQRRRLQDVMAGMRHFHARRMRRISEARSGLMTGQQVRVVVRAGRRQARPPPPPPRTKWTRRVPHPVLIGHAAAPIV